MFVRRAEFKSFSGIHADAGRFLESSAVRNFHDAPSSHGVQSVLYRSRAAKQPSRPD